MDNDEETAFMGLTDIISNLMVLFILLTVFVLTIKLSEASQDNSATGNNGRVGGEFINGLNSELYGTVTTFVVMENGFGQLDWRSCWCASPGSPVFRSSCSGVKYKRLSVST